MGVLTGDRVFLALFAGVATAIKNVHLDYCATIDRVQIPLMGDFTGLETFGVFAGAGVFLVLLVGEILGVGAN